MSEGFPETLRIILEPLASLLEDPAVTAVFVNGPDEVWVEKDGVVRRAEPAGRLTEGILLDAVRAAARFAAGGLSGEATRLEARFQGGARMSAVLPPAASKGPCLVLRPPDPTRMNLSDLVAAGSLTSQVRRFLEAVIRCRRNVVVHGSAGSGRTTLLGALAALAPGDARVLVLEETPELKLDAEHVVPVRASQETAPELVDSLRLLRPDLVVIGDLLGAEALPALRLMTGGVPVLTTVTGMSALDTLMRVEGMVHLGGVDLSPVAVRGLVTAALDIMVEVARFPDGSRRVVSVAEVVPLGVAAGFVATPLFAAPRPAGSTDTGELEVLGVEPLIAPMLRAAGFSDLTGAFFGVETAAALAMHAAAGEPEPMLDPDTPPPPPATLRKERVEPPASPEEDDLDGPTGPDRAGRLAPAAGAQTTASGARERAVTNILNAEDLEVLRVEDEDAGGTAPNGSGVEDSQGGAPANAFVSIGSEPGVTIGGAAVYTRPERPYAIEGSTGHYDRAESEEREATARGIQPKTSGESSSATPSGKRRRETRKTQAVQAPVLRRRDETTGDDPDSNEYIRATGGEQAAWDRGGAGSSPPFEATPSAPSPKSGVWDDEARRELREDRARRTEPSSPGRRDRPTLSVDVDLESEPSRESVTEDTTPGARIPGEFLEE